MKRSPLTVVCFQRITTIAGRKGRGEMKRLGGFRGRVILLVSGWKKRRKVSESLQREREEDHLRTILPSWYLSHLS